ncbi:mast cell protease 1A-like [Hyperolius riggenbachi]|uniref:mast cell protease 1A-like n=1 Tax=Hyperolius riggenbachi TaxID=752182 RepID=UPI0035A32E54
MRVFLPLFAATFTLFIHTYVCTEIIGGKEAKPHSRPYMAYIYTEIGNGQAATCDGALIDSSWVLTAAHCTINSSTIIKLGLHSLSNQGQYVQRFQVLNWIPHPHYNNLTFDNDVQLVQLNGTATSSNGVSPQKLPSAFSEVKAGTICKLAGWGRTSNDPKSNSDKLMEVSLPAISRDKCAEMWYPNKITKNMMCTLDPKTGKGSCNNFGIGNYDLSTGPAKRDIVRRVREILRTEHRRVMSTRQVQMLWSDMKRRDQDLIRRVTEEIRFSLSAYLQLRREVRRLRRRQRRHERAVPARDFTILQQQVMELRELTASQREEIAQLRGTGGRRD